MRRLTIQVDAGAEHCGNCHRLVVSEDLDKAHRGTCGVFQVGIIRGTDGQFARVTGCLNAERLDSEQEGTAA